MLDLIHHLQDQTPAPPQPASVDYHQSSGAPRPPAFDSRLIESIRHDHADLVGLFGQIGQCIDQRRYHEIGSILVAFKARLEGFLIAENERFNNYVELSLAGDSEDYALMRSLRREINVIARGVVVFVKRYQQCDFDDLNRVQFLADYRRIAALWMQRIEREESGLYPLYQPI